jgi:aminoglycoside phosphotransferase (APT) family kinase protein
VTGSPGRLIGVGRTADVYDIGGGRVLRRYREDLDVSFEAEVMRWARARGVPVPEVFDADGTDLVMERVDGPTLVDAAGRRPWRVPGVGRVLADLHDRLHRIDAPPVVRRRLGEGSSLLHMDLHPLNVLVGPDGPVVIDWVNVAAGDPGYDVAYAWMVVAAAELPARGLDRAATAVGRQLLLRAFLGRVDHRDAAARCLGRLRSEGLVTEHHFNRAELARMDALARRHGSVGGGALDLDTP